MNFVNQANLFILVNLRQLTVRPGAALVMALSIACAVGVFVAAMSMPAGAERVFAATARVDRALVVTTGSKRESPGLLQPGAIEAIVNMDDFAIVSPEVIVPLPGLVSLESDRPSRAYVRGVTPAAFLARPEVRIVRGEFLRPGRWDVLVGIRAARAFHGLDLGDTVIHPDFKNVKWTVRGHFHAGGGPHESELWVDKATLAAYRLDRVASSIWVVPKRPADFDGIRQSILDNPAVAGDLIRETDFFEHNTVAFTKPLRTFANLVGAIMAVGAIAATVNASFAAVTARKIELATLRSIGFGYAPQIAGLVMEMLLPALTGACVGLAVVSVVVDGVSIVGDARIPLVYDLEIPNHLSLLAFASAVGISALGTLFSAVYVTRLNTAAALHP